MERNLLSLPYNEDPVGAAAELLHIFVPGHPLISFASAEDLLSHARAAKLAVQNRLVEPEPADGGKTVFYLENQGCYRWARADGRVYGREAPGDAWVQHDALERFALQLCVFELAISAPSGHGGACVGTEEELALASAPFERLLGRWHWAYTELRVAERAIAIVNPGASVMFAAATADDMRALGPMIAATHEGWTALYLDGVEVDHRLRPMR